MPRFPLNIPPERPYTGPGGGMRVFGALRPGGRLHAGCDLYARVGTPIFAIAAGEVIIDPKPFYQGCFIVEVFHPGIGVVRYGEVLAPARYRDNQPQLRAAHQRSGITDLPAVITPPALFAGTPLTEGQLVASVGQLDRIRQPMLHFELYQEEARGTRLRGGGRFRRSPLLLNPTSLLQRLERGDMPATAAPPEPMVVADPVITMLRSAPLIDTGVSRFDPRLF